MVYPLEPGTDDKNPRPLDLDGREIALRSPRLGNTPAPHQYSNSKSESEDTLPESDGSHDVRLDDFPSQKYNSFGEAMKAIMAEFEQLHIKNMAEAKDMHEKLSTTVAESKEVYNRQMAEYINCYNKAKAVDAESARRLAEVRAEAARMLERLNGEEEEEVPREDMIRFVKKVLEICQRPVSSPSMAGH